MAEFKVQDTSLVAIADAIREKAGLSDSLVFPDGFVETVEGLATGGGAFATEVTPASNITDMGGIVVTHNLGVLPDYIIVCRKSDWNTEPKPLTDSVFLSGSFRTRNDTEDWIRYNSAVVYVNDATSTVAKATWGVGSVAVRNGDASNFPGSVYNVTENTVTLIGCKSMYTLFLQEGVTYKVLTGVL